MSTPIYLDNSATTLIEPAVVDAISACYRRVMGNPSSQHRLGRQAKLELEDAADVIRELLGARNAQPDADVLIVTSGGTEANNLALFGWSTRRKPSRLLISEIEHPSVLQAARQLQAEGHVVDWIRVRETGVVDLDHLSERLAADDGPPVSLVSVMLANNETGVLQPIEQIVQLCQAKQVPVHTDAVQAVGKIPIHFRQSGVAMMTLAAHKFNGPCGVGGLLVRGSLARRLEPILWGGSQQLGRRPGTESVPLVVGMQVALSRWCQGQAQRVKQLTQCRDRLQARLTSDVDAASVNGSGPRVPQTLNVSFPGVDRQALLMALDLAGICCSSGSACASGSSEPSHVLQAMRLPAERIESAIRLSVGLESNLTDMDQAADRILAALRVLKSSR